MKKIVFVFVIVMGFVCNSFAQYQGKIEVYKYADMTLHSYASAEEMGDVSFIIEGKDGLIVLEQQSFFNSIKDFGNYLKTLGKPVVKVVSSYHSGGLNAWDSSLVVMIEGMPEFEKGEMAQKMMKGFAERFGGKMDTRPHAETGVIPADSKQTWAGIDLQFVPAPSTSAFPAADIIIADKVFYTHSAPTISHIRGIRDRETIDKQLDYLKGIKNSGCELVVGSHGVAGRMDVVDFQITYLERMKKLLDTATSKEEFVAGMKDSFSGLPEERNLNATAANLYN
mgnify:FL=1